MLYYADGGPGPASKLLRVDAHATGEFSDWRFAPAERWQVKGGWKPEPQAQAMIHQSGDLFMIDESQVPAVQAQMREQYNRFH